MGSSGKGGETNWNEVAYGQSGQHFAGGGNRESLSIADPNYAPGGKYAAAADLAWGHQQQAQQAQAVQTEMMETLMTSMTGTPISQPSPQSTADNAELTWDQEGRFKEDASWDDISKYLGPAGEDQSYLYTSTDPSGKGAEYWQIENTPDFGSEQTGPGYTGKGYTGTGVSFTEGLNLRDEAIGAFTESLGKASTYVDQQIAQEQSNALLMGVDYNFNQEARDLRVGGALGDFGWGESQQSDMDEVLGKWGSSGFEQQIFGNATGGGSAEGTPTSEAAQRPGATGTLMTDDEEVLGTESILTGA